MKSKALLELSRAEGLLNNWRFLPGSEVKVLLAHLVKALDAVAGYALNSNDAVLERDYLLLSSVRLFDDPNIESSFYETYYALLGLIRKDVRRVGEDVVSAVSLKQVVNVDRSYFEGVIGTVKAIVNSAFQ